MTTELIHSTIKLPTAAADLQRKSLRSMTLNDLVEPVFLTLFDTRADFRALLEAAWDSDAVEGSRQDDDTVAAQMIRHDAPEGSPIKTKNLKTVRHSLRVVMRRYDISRNDRRRLLSDDVASLDA